MTAHHERAGDSTCRDGLPARAEGVDRMSAPAQQWRLRLTDPCCPPPQRGDAPAHQRAEQVFGV